MEALIESDGVEWSLMEALIESDGVDWSLMEALMESDGGSDRVGWSL